MVNRKRVLLFPLSILLCLAPVLWLLYTEKWRMLLELPPSSIASCFLFSAAAVCSSGYQYFLSLRQMGCRLDKKEILFFPYMQSLVGFLIPVQGTTIFAMLYLKLRYQFKIRQSIVMILFLYLLNFIFIGIAGMVYLLLYRQWNIFLFLGAMFCCLVPLYIVIAYRCLKSWGRLPLIPTRYSDLLLEFMASMSELLTDFPLLAKLLIFQLARQCLQAFAYVQVGQLFSSHPGFLWGYLVVVSQELAVILKMTPGNLGIAEAVAGVVSGITGVPFSDGVTASMFLFLVHVLLTSLFGLIGSYLTFMKYTSFKEVLSSIRREKERESAEPEKSPKTGA